MSKIIFYAVLTIFSVSVCLCLSSELVRVPGSISAETEPQFIFGGCVKNATGVCPNPANTSCGTKNCVDNACPSGTIAEKNVSTGFETCVSAETGKKECVNSADPAETVVCTEKRACSSGCTTDSSGKKVCKKKAFAKWQASNVQTETRENGEQCPDPA